MKALSLFYTTIALVASMPASGAELTVFGPTAQDEAQIDTLIDATIAKLSTDRARQAIADFFKSNPVMSGKQQQVDFFGVQAEASIVAFGQIRACQLIEKDNVGSWGQSRLYLCQHDNFLTRWIFDMIKTPKGWQAGNLRFDDKFSEGLK